MLTATSYMKSWRPQASPIRFASPLGILLCVLLLFWLWSTISARVHGFGLDPGVFLLGVAIFLDLTLAGTLAYLAWCIFGLGYAIDTSELVISCGGVRWVVPLAAVTAVYAPGEPVNGKPVVVRLRGVASTLPGYVVGAGRSPQLGPVLSIATAPPASQVFVRTAYATFGVSPQDPAGFVSALEQRTQSGEGIREAPVSTRLLGPAAWGAPLWSGAAARWLLLAGLVLSALFFGYVSLVYGSLPPNLPLHWDAQAQVDRIGDPLELVRLPVFALLIWLVNAVLASWAAGRERALSLFLLIGGAAAQVVFWAAVLSIVLRAA